MCSWARNYGFWQALLGIAAGALLGLAATDTTAADCGDTAGPGASRIACACGDTVVTSTRLRGYDPVSRGACHGDGLVIGADDITLHCNNHRIKGSGAEDTTGIALLERWNVTVHRCRIAGFGDGISVTGGGDHRFKDNRVFDSTRYGIAVGSLGERQTGSWGNRLVRNSVRRARAAIRIAEGESNDLDANIVRDAEDGIQLFAPDSVVTDNRVWRTKRGIILFEDSNGSRVEHNTVRRSDIGILLVGTRDSLVHRNNLQRNDVGIFIFDESGRDEISHNTLRRNGVGIQLAENVTLCHVARNSVERSSGSGFLVLAGPSANTFEANESEDNGGYGFEDVTFGAHGQGVDNVYLDNECEDNALGESSPLGLCSDERASRPRAGPGQRRRATERELARPRSRRQWPHPTTPRSGSDPGHGSDALLGEEGVLDEGRQLPPEGRARNDRGKKRELRDREER
jgi:parallel beta-helix repeat protein